MQFQLIFALSLDVSCDTLVPREKERMLLLSPIRNSHDNEYLGQFVSHEINVLIQCSLNFTVAAHASD